MKFLYLLVFILTTQEIFGQVVKQMPTEEEWQTYFYSNKKAIESKLYRLALDGKIKAYKTDSLISSFGLYELKIRGGKDKLTGASVNFGPVDSTYELFNADNFQNLWFVKTISSLPMEEKEASTLKAMTLNFIPIYGGFKAREQPMFFLSIQEIKEVLNNNEFEWIKLMYYYTSNDNNVLFQELNLDDSYWDLNQIKPAKVWYNCDSTIYKKLSNSLHINSFYVNDLFFNLKDKIVEPILFDHQTKKNISYYDFQVNYQKEMVVFMSTNPDNPTIGRDTVVFYPYDLEVTSVNIDKNNHSISAFNFEFKVSEKSDKTIRFSLDADRIRRRNTGPTLFWFFEDYFRWKK